MHVVRLAWSPRAWGGVASEPVPQRRDQREVQTCDCSAATDMSDSENEQMSGEGTPPASENEAPQDKTPPATPRPQQRSPASRAGKVLPMSPAWIKQKSTPKTKVRTAGYDCDKIASHAEIVLLSVPAGVKLEDLHGKQLTLPDQAGATSSIKGYRYEAIRGPDQSHKDLHLLTSMDGVANCKPVSAVYSLQRQLADVPADEEPVDENLLVSIREGALKYRSLWPAWRLPLCLSLPRMLV